MNSSEESDFSNVLLSARDDGNGCDVLLEKYRNYLTLLARIGTDRNLRAKVGDSDVVQETLIQANRDFGQFRGSTEQQLLCWIRAILSNKQAQLARKFYGATARNPLLEKQFSDKFDQSSQVLDSAFAANTSSPSQQLVGKERAVLLADALALLPDHYRDVVVLHNVKSMTFPEVAKEMERSLDSVKKLWARAIVQLRTMLKDSQDG